MSYVCVSALLVVLVISYSIYIWMDVFMPASSERPFEYNVIWNIWWRCGNIMCQLDQVAKDSEQKKPGCNYRWKIKDRSTLNASYNFYACSSHILNKILKYSAIAYRTEPVIVDFLQLLNDCFSIFYFIFTIKMKEGNNPQNGIVHILICQDSFSYKEQHVCNRFLLLGRYL